MTFTYQMHYDWLVLVHDGCTCFGGDAQYGHEPGCGLEPCVQLTEEDFSINLSVLWDMGSIDAPVFHLKEEFK